MGSNKKRIRKNKKDLTVPLVLGTNITLDKQTVDLMLKEHFKTPMALREKQLRDDLLSRVKSDLGRGKNI